MRKIFIYLFAVLLLACTFSLSSCLKKNDPIYKNEYSASDVADACLPALSSASLLSTADEDYIRYRMMVDTSKVESTAIFLQTAGTSIDEVGILKSVSDDTTDAEAIVQDYIKRRQEEWTGQYLVEEFPKLRDSEYKIFGRYVVYGILSESDKASLFTAASQFLAG